MQDIVKKSLDKKSGFSHELTSYLEVRIVEGLAQIFNELRISGNPGFRESAITEIRFSGNPDKASECPGNASYQVRKVFFVVKTYKYFASARIVVYLFARCFLFFEYIT